MRTPARGDAVLRRDREARPVECADARHIAVEVERSTAGGAHGRREEYKSRAMHTVQAWGAPAAGKRLQPMTIERREPGPRDVVIDVKFCGVCHSDIHQARDEWTGAMFPMVPGHEVVGIVTRVGKDVTKVKVGGKAGVGCMVDSCRDCPQCGEGHEQYCMKGMAPTYNGTLMDRVTPTYGGYSTELVVDEAF